MSDDFSSHEALLRTAIDPSNHLDTFDRLLGQLLELDGAQLAEHAPPIDGVLHRVVRALLRRRYDPSPLVARISAFFERVLQYVALRLREHAASSAAAAAASSAAAADAEPPPPLPPEVITCVERLLDSSRDYYLYATDRRPLPLLDDFDDEDRILGSTSGRSRSSSAAPAAAAADGGGDELIGDAAEELSWVSGLLQRHINSFARAGGFRAALRVVETPGSLSLPVRVRRRARCRRCRSPTRWASPPHSHAHRSHLDHHHPLRRYFSSSPLLHAPASYYGLPTDGRLAPPPAPPPSAASTTRRRACSPTAT